MDESTKLASIFATTDMNELNALASEIQESHRQAMKARSITARLLEAVAKREAELREAQTAVDLATKQRLSDEAKSKERERAKMDQARALEDRDAIRKRT